MSQRTERILLAIKEVITMPSERDMQQAIGPSDLGDSCNHCLAAKMAGEKPERDFSMYPWLGTAIHRLIEYLTDRKRFFWQPDVNNMAWSVFGNKDAQTEVRIFICEIPGYGKIYGSIDYLLPNEKCIVDWKSSSLKKVRFYRLHGVPLANLGQTIMYLHGALAAGYDVEAAVLVYIPRDAADLRQFYAYEVFYSAEEAQSIIERATVIQQWIDAGRWRELESSPDCYTCNPTHTF